MKITTILTAMVMGAIAVSFGQPAQAARIIHFPMEADAAAQLTETVSGQKIRLYGQHAPENVNGAAGKALRLDGYSSYATGTLAPQGNGSHEAMTVSLWVAPEIYPIIKHDEATAEKIILAGTLDETAKKGWAIMLGSTGKYSFVCFTGGWKTEVEAPDPLPHYEWSRITAVADNQHVTLYRNGEKVKEGKSLGAVDDSSTTIFIGKGADSRMLNGFNINTFNGLIDDLEVYDEAIDATQLSSLPDNIADLSIPEQRFAADLLRPRFHGMPAAGWTNESHGMTYSNGKYHLFFQKNANGPYMSRLHWGHISSPDLINWTEEKVALFPDMDFDVKGCWSGCVFTDDAITGGKPNIIYTGVDYVKAYIAQAVPLDDDLIEWRKSSSPIINGKPGGLSDDFRDPYFFRNGENAYVIVGTSKDGIGAVTLHKYLPNGNIWTNNTGDIFFAGTDKSSCGTFWEMPNITPMGGGKWLFTATPQNTGVGVRTLYWTGEINSDGTFKADAASAFPRGVELISKEGYGLLSPTIFQKDGKTIALGIVPDKVSGSINYNLGWAHCYSLPREWSLDEKGNLVQKPYEGLRAARSEDLYDETNFTLDGTRDMDPVYGRQVELLARFKSGNAAFGFRFFKSGSSEAVLKYQPASNLLTVDFSKLERTANDNGSYNGVYTCVLPEQIPAGSDVTINLFIDGSILDIFVNEKWATSIRVFPKAADADGIEAFSDGPLQVTELKGWNLDLEAAGIDMIEDSWSQNIQNGPVDVFDIQGRLLKSKVERTFARDGLSSGIYIIGGQKILIP